MNHPFSDPHPLSRALIACLIISLMILSPLAPLAPWYAEFINACWGPLVAWQPPAPFAPNNHGYEDRLIPRSGWRWQSCAG